MGKTKERRTSRKQPLTYRMGFQGTVEGPWIFSGWRMSVDGTDNFGHPVTPHALDHPVEVTADGLVCKAKYNFSPSVFLSKKIVLHMTLRCKILDCVSPSILEATQEYFPPCWRVTACNTKLEPDIMIPLSLSCKTITSCKDIRKIDRQYSIGKVAVALLRCATKPLCRPPGWRWFYTRSKRRCPRRCCRGPNSIQRTRPRWVHLQKLNYLYTRHDHQSLSCDA